MIPEEILGIHPSWYLLGLAAISFILSLVFHGKREPSGSLTKIAHDDQKPENVEEHYRKYNGLKKWCLAIFFLSLIAAAVIWGYLQLASR